MMLTRVTRAQFKASVDRITQPGALASYPVKFGMSWPIKAQLDMLALAVDQFRADAKAEGLKIEDLGQAVELFDFYGYGDIFADNDLPELAPPATLGRAIAETWLALFYKGVDQ